MKSMSGLILAHDDRRSIHTYPLSPRMITLSNALRLEAILAEEIISGNADAGITSVLG